MNHFNAFTFLIPSFISLLTSNTVFVVQGMAGGLMSQVTGMVPGMKKEEEVPDVAPQEGEYQEYTVSRYKPGFLMRR